MTSWLRRTLIRRARARRQRRVRVIVSDRPYDWELDGIFDDDEQTDTELSHADTGPCHTRPTGDDVDDDARSLVHLSEYVTAKRGERTDGS